MVVGAKVKKRENTGQFHYESEFLSIKMDGDRNCGEISASTLRKNRPDPVEANIIQKAANSNT